MKTVEQLRSSLANIDGVFIDIPPEARDYGDDEGVTTLIEGDFDSTEATVADFKLSDYEEEEESSDWYSILEYGADIDESHLRKGLSGGKGDAIHQSVMQKGVDALAYYSSFHGRGVQWGIYIPVSSLEYMMVHVFGDLNIPPIEKLRLAFRAIHQHELFHFRVDYALAQAECWLKQPLFCYKHKTRDPIHGYTLEEEKWANASMIRSFWGQRIAGKTEALRKFVKMQPVGYRDAIGATDGSTYNHGVNVLLHDYLYELGSAPGWQLDGLSLDTLYPDVKKSWRYCPVHIIHDDTRLSLDPKLFHLIQKVEYINETSKFIKRLNNCSHSIQDAWQNIKQKLRNTTTLKGLDFKLWERVSGGSVYSVRVNRNYRVHLKQEHKGKSWQALDIGNHKYMGHG